MSCRAYEFYDCIEHQVLILPSGSVGVKYLLVFVVHVNRRDEFIICYGLVVEAVIKIPVKKLYELRVFGQVCDYGVSYSDYHVDRGHPGVRISSILEIIDRIEKDSLGFMRYKVVDDILLVFEVEVEGSLRNSGARSDVGYGCVRYAFGSEQII